MRCVQPSRRSLHAARAVCPYDEVPIEAPHSAFVGGPTHQATRSAGGV